MNTSGRFIEHRLLVKLSSKSSHVTSLRLASETNGGDNPSRPSTATLRAYEALIGATPPLVSRAVADRVRKEVVLPGLFRRDDQQTIVARRAASRHLRISSGGGRKPFSARNLAAGR